MFFLLSLLIGAQTASGSQVGADDVQTLIETNGATKALSVLWEDDLKWEALSKGIATGKATWLRIAAELRAVSDAGTTESLEEAVQEALPNNSAGVLRLVAASVFTVRDVCGMYGFGQIEDRRPVPVLLGLVDKRIAAVSRVPVQELKTVRDTCLNELRNLRRDLQRSK
jgi:hypothetical protein